MHFFCPSCWKEIRQEQAVCPHCRIDIKSYETQADFTDKLLSATEHFEAETRIRAVTILGQRKEKKAIPKLLELARRTDDPFLTAAALESLFQIGRDQFTDVFKEASKNQFYIIANKAKTLLSYLENRYVHD